MTQRDKDKIVEYRVMLKLLERKKKLYPLKYFPSESIKPN